MSGRLVVCPTPIGNLEDVTLRVLAALREADIVACEDTRRTRVLLDRYGVRAHLVSYHEHNEAERAAELVKRMQEGAVVALVSDAGMPLVSDPGYVLVAGCVAAGLAVRSCRARRLRSRRSWRARCRPTAGASSGSCRASAASCEEVFGSPETLVAFESPRRVAASLRALAELDPERPVAVCRELTKVHEEVVRGSGGRAWPSATPMSRRAARSCSWSAPRLRSRVTSGPPWRRCAAWSTPAPSRVRRPVVVADLTGVSANALYRALTQ